MLNNTVWNTLGSIVYFACQWLITVIVVWLYDDGYTNAGNLALAMSITNVFYCVAAYNIRAFQVTDVHGEHTDSEYMLARIITCIGAMVLCAGFVLMSGYTHEKILIIVCYMGFRTVEALIDVLHGIVHKHRRLDYAGMSMVARGLLMLAAFSAFGRIFDLLPAIAAMTVATAIFGILYDITKSKKLATLGTFSYKHILVLLKRCFPLMLVTLLFIFYVSYARYALERIYGTQDLGGYATAVTPAVAVQVAVQFLLAPLISLFAVCVKESDQRKFIKLFAGTFAVIAGITLVAAVLAHFAGLWALEFVFGQEISAYAHLLPSAVVVTGMTATLWLMNAVFSTIRDTKGILFGSLLGAAVCIAASEYFLSTHGLIGANYALIVCQGVVLIALCFRFIWLMRNCPYFQSNNLQS